MAKKGMKRYYKEANKNEIKPVEELQGKVKSEKEKAKPLSFSLQQNRVSADKSFFGLADSDCAIQNITNDLGLTAADMQDFRG